MPLLPRPHRPRFTINPGRGLGRGTAAGEAAGATAWRTMGIAAAHLLALPPRHPAGAPLNLRPAPPTSPRASPASGRRRRRLAGVWPAPPIKGIRVDQGRMHAVRSHFRVRLPLIGVAGVATRRAALAGRRPRVVRRSNRVRSSLIGASGVATRRVALCRATSGCAPLNVRPRIAGVRRASPASGRASPIKGIRMDQGRMHAEKSHPRVLALDRRSWRGDTPCCARRTASARGSEIEPRAFALDRRRWRGDTPCCVRRTASARGLEIEARAFGLDRRGERAAGAVGSAGGAA
jgi:hypothetical protein